MSEPVVDSSGNVFIDLGYSHFDTGRPDAHFAGSIAVRSPISPHRGHCSPPAGEPSHPGRPPCLPHA